MDPKPEAVEVPEVEDVKPEAESIEVSGIPRQVLDALKIKREDVMGFRKYEDRVVVVTRGGQKLVYRK